jgi:FtsZ-binding cell division protein ZapB
MAMEINDLKTINEKLQSELKQAQSMEEYYLK